MDARLMSPSNISASLAWKASCPRRSHQGTSERSSLWLKTINPNAPALQPARTRELAAVGPTFALKQIRACSRLLTRFTFAVMEERSLATADVVVARVGQPRFDSNASRPYHAKRKSNMRDSNHNKVAAQSDVAQIAKAMMNAGHSGRGDCLSSSITTETCVWSRLLKGISINTLLEFRSFCG